MYRAAMCSRLTRENDEAHEDSHVCCGASQERLGLPLDPPTGTSRPVVVLTCQHATDHFVSSVKNLFASMMYFYSLLLLSSTPLLFLYPAGHQQEGFLPLLAPGGNCDRNRRYLNKDSTLISK